MSRFCGAYDEFKRGVSREMEEYGKMLTHEGIFAHHGQEFSQPTPAAQTSLVNPVFKPASSRNPLTQEMEYYMAIGLQPVIDQVELVKRRNPFCLVFVVDISGAMAMAYDYLEDHGRMTKLDAAKRLVEFTARKLLAPDDAYAIVTYRSSHDSRVSCEAASVTLEGLGAAEGFGGCDLDGAMTAARRQMQNLIDERAEMSLSEDSGRVGCFAPKAKDRSRGHRDDNINLKLSRRYIVLTDQDCNHSINRRSYHDANQTRPISTFLSQVQEESEADAFTLMLGIGTSLPQADAWKHELRGIKGCNFGLVTDEIGRYEAELNKEFASMITPIATDFSMELHASPFSAGKLLGWEAPAHSVLHSREGEFLRITTLFPMLDFRGGIYALKLNPKSFGKASVDGGVPQETTVCWQYRDINGERQQMSKTFDFTQIFPFDDSVPNGQYWKDDLRRHQQRACNGRVVADSVYADDTVRRVVMLSRYVDFCHWICETYTETKEWFAIFEKYWEAEMQALQDPTKDLESDLETLRHLIEQKDVEEPPTCSLM